MNKLLLRGLGWQLHNYRPCLATRVWATLDLYIVSTNLKCYVGTPVEAHALLFCIFLMCFATSTDSKGSMIVCCAKATLLQSSEQLKHYDESPQCSAQVFKRAGCHLKRAL